MADEVRRLAERSKASAADIADIVESTRSETSATLLTMEKGAKQLQQGMALLEVVDALVGRRNVVVKGLSPLLPRVDVLAGAALEPDGSVLLVLNADGLVAHARRLLDGSPPHPHDDATSARETPNGPGRLG